MVSCQGQQRSAIVPNTIEPTITLLASDTGAPLRKYGPKIEFSTCYKNWISEYVPCVFQDSRGDMWFATNGDGVVHYKGTTLKYYTPTDGFGDIMARDIVEDDEGNLWFGTNVGVT